MAYLVRRNLQRVFKLNLNLDDFRLPAFNDPVKFQHRHFGVISRQNINIKHVFFEFLIVIGGCYYVIELNCYQTFWGDWIYWGGEFTVLVLVFFFGIS